MAIEISDWLKDAIEHEVKSLVEERLQYIIHARDDKFLDAIDSEFRTILDEMARRPIFSTSEDSEESLKLLVSDEGDTYQEFDIEKALDNEIKINTTKEETKQNLNYVLVRLEAMVDKLKASIDKI